MFCVFCSNSSTMRAAGAIRRRHSTNGGIQWLQVKLSEHIPQPQQPTHIQTLYIQRPRCLFNFKSKSTGTGSGLTTPYWTIHKSRSRNLCTNFTLADSWHLLDWHPICNAATEQAEKLLGIRKYWTAAYPPIRPDNQGANPMLPNDDNLVRIEEEVN